MAQVILFQDANYHGAHAHVFFAEPNFHQGVSSLVVIEGNWAFYVDPNFQTPNPPVFGPGLYPDLSLYPNLPAGIKNMSSLQPVDAAPTVFADVPANSHVILFENANYHGNHKHIFHAEDNLNADDDDGFNDAVSSFHILSGLWVFYKDAGYRNPYADGRQFGPAIDGSWVGALGITDNDMSSLKSVQ